MITITLQAVAELVVRRAQRQGYILAREVREELINASLPETHWKDVLALARASLSYRRGRYYYMTPVSERVRQEQSQQLGIQKVVRQLIKQYQEAASEVERREAERYSFVQPVQVRTEDDRTCTLLSRDISPTGIRLIGTKRFLGQKLRVSIPRTDNPTPLSFLVRVLWTCAISEDLFENGGMFLELLDNAEPGTVKS